MITVEHSQKKTNRQTILNEEKKSNKSRKKDYPQAHEHGIFYSPGK